MSEKASFLKRFNTAWEILSQSPSEPQLDAIGDVLAEHGLVYGCRLDPAKGEGAGIRIRASNPQRLCLNSCHFIELHIDYGNGEVSFYENYWGTDA